MGDRLRSLWDFSDLDGSEQRLRAQLAAEPADDRRAEVLTQLARVEGLRGRFEACDALLAQAEELARPDGLARVRVELERGRRLRSSGDSAAALPLFERAVERALAAGSEWLACDAAHMAALAAPDRPGLVAWTERGVALARKARDPDAAYWLGPLLNNLGWALDEAGDHEAALAAFAEALEAREREPKQPREIEIARYAVAKSLRALGRAGEAAALLEQAVASAETRGEADGWFHQELAESYAELGRRDEAAAQARLALPLLEAEDAPLEQLARLRTRLGMTTR